MHPKVDEFIATTTRWQKEIIKLRAIVLDCGLTEELKWKQPCYTYNNSNVLIVSSFKDYCFISFLKGVLLQDTHNLLVSPGKNSQSVRFIKFNTVQEIIKLEPTIKAYIYEALEVEKAGLKVNLNKSSDLELVEELQRKLKEKPQLKTAFEALTPGRQRAYNIYFSAAQQAKTRESRIEKYIPRILDGKGINDCVCGLTKKSPSCDGSHKYLSKQTAIK